MPNIDEILTNCCFVMLYFSSGQTYPALPVMNSFESVGELYKINGVRNTSSSVFNMKSYESNSTGYCVRKDTIQPILFKYGYNSAYWM